MFICKNFWSIGVRSRRGAKCIYGSWLDINEFSPMIHTNVKTNPDSPPIVVRFQLLTQLHIASRYGDAQRSYQAMHERSMHNHACVRRGAAKLKAVMWRDIVEVTMYICMMFIATFVVRALTNVLFDDLEDGGFPEAVLTGLTRPYHICVWLGHRVARTVAFVAGRSTS